MLSSYGVDLPSYESLVAECCCTSDQKRSYERCHEGCRPGYCVKNNRLVNGSGTYIKTQAWHSTASVKGQSDWHVTSVIDYPGLRRYTKANTLKKGSEELAAVSGVTVREMYNVSHDTPFKHPESHACTEN